MDCETNSPQARLADESLEFTTDDYICEGCNSWICDCGMDDSIELPPFPGS